MRFLFLLALLALPHQYPYYPDPVLTPGTVIRGIDTKTTCHNGYARLARHVSKHLKTEVMKRYKLDPATQHLYEIDHFIPLNIGGTNDITNLWPEPLASAHDKDKVEFFLYQEVCHSRMQIEDAQDQIKTDWVKVFNTLPAHK